MRSLRHLPAACAAFALTGLLAGCASVGAPVPPSLELPKPPNDLRAVRKGSKVHLFWTIPTRTTDRQTVRRPGPTRICRTLAATMTDCDVVVGNFPPAASVSGMPAPDKNRQQQNSQAEFTDTLPPDLQQQNPTRMATYTVEALNREARSAGLSNQVQVALAPTLPPPANIKTQVISDGVVLTWDCETPRETAGLHYVYRIYRRSADTAADVKLSDETCPANMYEDHSIEWQKNYEYKINVVTFVNLMPKVLPCSNKIEDNGDNTTTIAFSNCVNLAIIEGDDSAPLKVFTNDVFPPGVPSGLQAVFSGPGQAPFVDLLWAPDTDADLAGYNVYRREEGLQPSKINDNLIKAPAYRDANVAPGKTYGYSVTAVDLRGNESAHSDEATEAVPQN